MTQPPERPKPPKLVPGEPLWGTPDISPPGQSPAPTPRPAPENRRTGSGTAATGAARPTAGRAQAAPPPPPPGPVQFGPTPSAVPQASGYGRATTYGGAESRDRYPTAGEPTGKRPVGLLIVTAVVFFLLGAAVGLTVGWFVL